MKNPISKRSVRADGITPWFALLLLCACCATLPVHAETLYVTDILRLGLHQASDTSDAPFRTLVSGDVLEILERTTYYARVRTARGEEGWVKASYLTAEMPAQTRLAGLTAERDTLVTELAELRSQLTRVNSELTEVRRDRDALAQRTTVAENEAVTLSSKNASLAQTVSAHRFSVPAQWVLLGGAVILIGGFLAGWWWSDAKQRARHGGFRI